MWVTWPDSPLATDTPQLVDLRGGRCAQSAGVKAHTSLLCSLLSALCSLLCCVLCAVCCVLCAVCSAALLLSALCCSVHLSDSHLPIYTHTQTNVAHPDRTQRQIRRAAKRP